MARAIGLGVEHRQLVPGAAPADDHDGVEAARAANEAMARGHHGDGVVALHAHVAHRELEAEPTGGELLVEVVPRGRADAGDDADVHRRPAERRPPVGVEEAAGDQPPHHLIALLGQVAEREPGVDAGHHQLDLAAGRVEVEVAVDADLDPVAEAESMTLEHRAQAVAAGREHRHVDDRLGVGGVGGVVGEGEVGVGSAGVPSLDLAAYPQPVARRPGCDG